MQQTRLSPFVLPKAKCVQFFEVRGRYYPEDGMTPDGKLPKGKRTTVRVTANTLYEALTFIREKRPSFLFTTVKHLGHIWVTPNTIPFQFSDDLQVL